MLNNLILPFQTAKALRSIKIKIKKNNKNIIFLKIFHSMGLIQYYYYKMSRIIIRFNYVNYILVLQFFRLFKKKSKQFILKRKLLNKFLTNNKYMILLENSYNGRVWLNKTSTSGGRLLAVIHN